MGNDWFREYFINELKAIGRKPTSNMQYEVVDSLPSSGNEQTIYFVKNNSSSSNNHYDEYVWISSSSTFEKIGSTQIDGSATQPDWNQNDSTAADYVKNRPFYTGDPAETVLVEETTIPFEVGGGGIYVALPQLAFDAIVGETYKVSWDGTVYESVCLNFQGAIIIGNLSITGEGSDTGEPFLIVVGKRDINIHTLDTASSHVISISERTTQVVKIDEKYLPIINKPEGKSYLTFSSPNEFILSCTKKWDGTLEYFTSDNIWTTWDGSTISAVLHGGEYALYLRGTGNSVITREYYSWNLDGTDIKCIGNIENLLDYTTVESGNHPIMGNDCYRAMFRDCTALTQAPALPATTLAKSCYYYMFYGCTALTQAPALPATTLAESCYEKMFYGCTALTQAPALPATTLAKSCYYYMFYGCTALTQAPALPATTLAEWCYRSMFYGCTALTQTPDLPATTLAEYCYNEMFSGCTNLKLSSTKTNEYMQEYRIPSSGNGVTASSDLSGMFINTGGTFTGTPEINTTYYLSSDNMIIRETEIATLNGYVSSMIDTALSAIGIAEEGAY